MQPEFSIRGRVFDSAQFSIRVLVFDSRFSIRVFFNSFRDRLLSINKDLHREAILGTALQPDANCVAKVTIFTTSLDCDIAIGLPSVAFENSMKPFELVDFSKIKHGNWGTYRASTQVELPTMSCLQDN